MPLINYNANRQEALGGEGRGGIQRGTLSNITASVTSSCVNFEDTGIISMSGITGGRGPVYNYSLFDLTASVFVTQSTAVSSAIISDLSNSTYLLNISNEGVFAYTQSVTVSCPPPPDLEVDYIVVGGGAAGLGTSNAGGSAGGVRSGSLSIPYKTSLSASIGLGGTSDGSLPITNAESSSISSSVLGFFGAGGATGNSGQPTEFSQGTSGPGGTQGGGAGSSKNGNDGVLNQNGDGGTGSLWLDGLYYAGGGGGVGNVGNPGFPGLGGGGTAQTGTGPDDLPYQLNGYNGRGGGAASTGTSGGSGVVIIRYSTGSVRPAFGGTVTEAGGYIYHTFTGSGDFRYDKQ